jgi:hypothetical protein
LGFWIGGCKISWTCIEILKFLLVYRILPSAKIIYVDKQPHD